MIRVVARRDDTLMVADLDAGPGAILWRDGMEPHVIHRDSALAAGYWDESSEPLPDLPAEALDELAAFNAKH